MAGKAGAHDVDAVEGCLGSDLRGLASKAKAGVGDVEGEVLGHLVLVEHGTDAETVSATPRSGWRLRGTAAAMRARSRSVAGEQILALARALGSERAITAD